ncbi:putative DNA-binding domain-containing protein [Pseudomonas mosselii]|uniref:HvfC/BufC N-terminal domain-containing protein n=1 Tax=Pseudomonas mosselii TaxID=78327 RepID=UPI00164532A5|nr:DNA-binding domain-containing protein [Pseudomonas mosselii]MBC3452659.1 putative DNA-binding domain-containing protein [Pseudomonas mosselii]
MNLSLGQFQNAFTDALYQRPAPELAALTAQSAFAVYRNTVLAGCVEALRANFSSVETLVGQQWMHDAAAEYARQSPPCDVRMIRYGAAFPAFLEALQPVHGLCYLADVARLDFAWCEAFSADDDPWLRLADLAGMTASDLEHSQLSPRSGVRWHWFDQHPVYSLWQHGRDGRPWPEDQPWVAEGALLSGDREGVVHQPLSLGGCIFLDACAAGYPLDKASQLALHAQPNLDFSDLLGRLLNARALRPLAFT